MSCLCDHCQLDLAPEGCHTPITKIEVVKGVGVVDCEAFQERK